MNQRLRVLAAAAEMQRFTAYDLAAATGISTNTVRSTLRREEGFFEVAPTPGTERSRGRPTNLYTLTDREGLRKELSEVRESLDWTPVPAPEMSDGEHEYARLEVAENSLRRALASDDHEDRRKLIDVAARTANFLLDRPELQIELGRRALALKASAEIAGLSYRDAPERIVGLNQVADAIAAIVSFSASTALALLHGLLGVTRELELAPPVGLLVHGDMQPENILLGDDADWTRVADHEGLELWSPGWSRPLAEKSVLAGVVLGAEADQANIASSLSELRTWTPRVVMGDYSPALIDQTARLGALFVPKTGDDLTASVIDGIVESLDQRVATIDTDEDPVIADFVSSSQRGQLVLEVKKARRRPQRKSRAARPAALAARSVSPSR